MKKIITSITVASALFLTNCGPDSYLVQDGIIHSCNIKKIEAQMQLDPDNAELKQEYLLTVEFLKATIENEKESNRDALRKAIAEGAKDCK